MGTSHFKSNIVGKAGSETIRGFTTISATTLSGTTITGSGTVSGANVYASSKMRIGSTQYLLVGALNTEASIVAVATAVTATPQGSLYISTAGKLWIFDGATTATSFATAA